MNRFCQLLEKYDRLVIFDTETTGLQWSRDEIIEFAAVTVEAGETALWCPANMTSWWP